MTLLKTWKERTAAAALAVSVGLTGIAGNAFGADGDSCPPRELVGPHTEPQAQQASASGPKSIVIRENLNTADRWELDRHLNAYRIKGYLAYAVPAAPGSLPEGYVEAYVAGVPLGQAELSSRDFGLLTAAAGKTYRDVRDDPKFNGLISTVDIGCLGR